MNKEEFEREVLRIAGEHWSRDRDNIETFDILGNALSIRDLLEKDLAENNPPVAWKSHSGTLATCKDSLMPSTRELATPLYVKPPVTQIPEGWQLVPKEATPAMQAAALRVFPCSQVDTYRAMLLAALEYKEDK